MGALARAAPSFISRLSRERSMCASFASRAHSHFSCRFRMARSLSMRPALGEHVKVVVLGQQLHLDARPHLVPGQADERLFQLAEASLGGSHQIGDGRIGLPHFGQHLFGGDAAVHHPDALGLAVLRLDLRKEGAQCRLVGGVTGSNFVGERKSVGRHDQRDDNLHAV